MIELTESNWGPHAEAGRPLFVQYWAPWSGPCRLLAPTVAALESHFARKVAFGRVNVDDNVGLCVAHEVRTIPLLILFLPGREPLRLVGMQSEATIARMLYRAVE